MKRKLGVYIHVPFCNGKCAYCDFVSDVYSEEIKQAYFIALINEINNFNFSEYIVDTVYIGGGTPSSVDPAFIVKVLQKLKNCAKIELGCEISIECNPESVTEEKLIAYKDAGVNRISFGLQTANDRILKSIGRLHSLNDFIEAIDVANKYYNNVSADLMLGLPNQTLSDVNYAIELLVDKKIKHVSAYGLKVEDGTPLSKSGFNPDEDFTSELYDFTVEKLENQGYIRYEVSNFAKKGFECKHNKRYWKREEYKGFGVAAHSFVENVRLENTRNLIDYIKGRTVVDRCLISPKSEEAKEEMLMLALRTSEGLDLNQYHNTFGENLLKEKFYTISALSDFLIVENNRLKLSKKGYYVMNEIIVRLIDKIQ